MDICEVDRAVQKESLLDNLSRSDLSSLKKYQDFFVGTRRIGALVEFELITLLLGSMPGALGFLFRKWLYPNLFRTVGSGVLWGKDIALRHPAAIEIGDRVAIDDDCLLDARGAGEEGIQIGNDVLIARGAIIQGKCSWIKIGDHCTIGSQCLLTSAGGISLGKSVLMAGQCYIGGARYRFDDREVPIMDQGAFTKGPVVIQDDVWLGAGVTVMDGVCIGKGCVIGAGAVVRENLPDFTVAMPHQKLLLLPRGEA